MSFTHRFHSLLDLNCRRNHTGSHKINNAIGQILLARRIGKTRIIAETGAGQHGVATATACARFGMECVIYMGAEDVRRQALNVFRIRMLGGKVIPVESGSKTLKDAINEAMRDWITNLENTHYLVGSAIGPHPFPTIVRDFQKIIGEEIKVQLHVAKGKLPDAVVACVGGGSNAIGTFYDFINDKSVRIVGVEAAGDGIDTARHSATLSKGTPGVLHGVRTYLLQDKDGQIIETHSISAGLDYPGVGPEHAFLKDNKRAEYTYATDEQALRAFRLLTQNEGIIPGSYPPRCPRLAADSFSALESSHAIWGGLQVARDLPKDSDVVIVCPFLSKPVPPRLICDNSAFLDAATKTLRKFTIFFPRSGRTCLTGTSRKTRQVLYSSILCAASLVFQRAQYQRISDAEFAIPSAVQ